jgi:hypothetical protein
MRPAVSAASGRKWQARQVRVDTPCEAAAACSTHHGVFLQARGLSQMLLLLLGEVGRMSARSDCQLFMAILTLSR